MCLILDTCKYRDYLSDKVDMKPVKTWHRKHGNKFVYSPTKVMSDELRRTKKMHRNFKHWIRYGKVKQIDKQKVEKRMCQLEKRTVELLKSNDIDIIALALVSKVKLLVSGDKKLKEDFSHIVGGNTYEKKEEEYLLVPCTHIP